MKLSELEITALLKEELNSRSPISEFWHELHEKPLSYCPEKWEKKSGAKADLCFLKENETCLLIENKITSAELQPRQRLFYLNQFSHFYQNCGLMFKEHKLVFVCRGSDTRKVKELKNLFTEDYQFPTEPLGKTNLSDVIMVKKGIPQKDGFMGYWTIATYKSVPRDLAIKVKVLAASEELLAKATRGMLE